MELQETETVEAQYKVSIVKNVLESLNKQLVA